MRKLSGISVVIPCHNYGHYLPNCLQSIIGQTRPASEILVVDDSSDDDVEAIVRQFSAHNVRYLRVEYRSPLLARREGMLNTSGSILCFIDADDTIESDYFEKGMSHFSADRRTAIVYSDVVFSGTQLGRSEYPSNTLEADLSVENFIHCGALVRRDALEVADAFNHGGPARRHEDWSLWRKVIAQGFTGVKQQSLYRYNKHAQGLSRDRHYDQNGYTYFEGAALAEEIITLCTPLAGRREYWDKYRNFLENQSWNHNKVRLILMDTSHDADFGRMIRRWLSESDYRDYSYIKYPVGRKGLADEKRTDHDGHGRTDILRDVRVAMGRIYNRLARMVDTNYVWIVEDDIIPPLDAAERLMRGFCQSTVSVTGAFRHRYEDSYVVWNKNHVCLKSGSGVEQVGGNGFGCVMLRSGLLKESVFSRRPDHEDYDKAFYADLKENQIAKIDWDVACDHLSPVYLPEEPPAVRPAIKRENFDEKYYLSRNPDVKEAIETGAYNSAWEHFELFGRSEGRVARSLPPQVPAGSISIRLERTHDDLQKVTDILNSLR